MQDQVHHTISDTSLGIYIYCLTKTPVSSDIMGIDGVHKVYFAEQDGIFAAVSNIFLHEFNENTLEKNMTEITWLVPMAKKHDEIIRFVMIHDPINHHENPTPFLLLCEEDEMKSPLNNGVFIAQQCTPVIPLRFCTIYKNRERLFKTVIPHKEKIVDFLDYTTDKGEWSVKVFCDKKVFMDSCCKKEQAGSVDQASLLPGESYLFAKKIRKQQEETFSGDIRKILNDICSTLIQYAGHYRFLMCTGKNTHGRSLDMVLNAAFLIEWKAFALFKNTVDMLAEIHKNKGIVFEFMGPWPPYNFCPEITII